MVQCFVMCRKSTHTGDHWNCRSWFSSVTRYRHHHHSRLCRQVSKHDNFLNYALHGFLRPITAAGSFCTIATATGCCNTRSALCSNYSALYILLVTRSNELVHHSVSIIRHSVHQLTVVSSFCVYINKKLSYRWQTARRICVQYAMEWLIPQNTPLPHIYYHAEFGLLRQRV